MDDDPIERVAQILMQDTMQALTDYELAEAAESERDVLRARLDELVEAITHERETVCQDFDMQFSASQSVERCLDAYRKARGQDA